MADPNSPSKFVALKRDGEKALRFKGSLLFTHSADLPKSGQATVSLYTRNAGGFAVAFSRSLQGRAFHSASLCVSLDAAMSFVERALKTPKARRSRKTRATLSEAMERVETLQVERQSRMIVASLAGEAMAAWETIATERC